MAKNLRQKYKEAKKQLREMKWRLLYPTKPLTFVDRGDLSIRKVSSVKTVDIFEVEHVREILKSEMAFDLARHMIKNDMIKNDMVNISETFDPHSGKVYICAEVNVVDYSKNA